MSESEYRDLMAAITSVVENTGMLSTRIDARFAAIDARFDKIDARLDAMDVRFDGIERRLTNLEDRVERGFSEMGRRLDRMERTFL